MKIFYSCIFLLLLFISSCSNWNENPSSVIPEGDGQSFELITKLSYPEKTNKILFLTDNNILAGSSDGKFYKSSDDGKTWRKTGEINSGEKINCFFEFEETVAKKRYIYSGTENGIYISSDAGSSWKESFISAEGNAKVQVYCFEKIFNTNSKQDSIVAYGWDGRNNKFKLCFGEDKWSREILSSQMRYKIISRVEFIVKLSPASFYPPQTATVVYYCGSDGIDSYTYLYKHYNQSPYWTYYYFNKYPGTGNLNSGLSINNSLLLSTEKGVIVINNETNVYQGKQLIESGVQSIQSDGEIVIASTNDGLFYSNDFGLSFQRMNISYSPESIIETYLPKNKILLVKKNGDVYSGSFYKDKKILLFNPLLVEPFENSIVDNSNVKFVWKQLEEHPYAISALQVSTSSVFKPEETLTIDEILQKSQIVSQLKNNTTYYWRVIVYDLYFRQIPEKVSVFKTKQAL